MRPGSPQAFPLPGIESADNRPVQKAVLVLIRHDPKGGRSPPNDCLSFMHPAKLYKIACRGQIPNAVKVAGVVDRRVKAKEEQFSANLKVCR